MLPMIALVGRPNVGKSTLFNALTRTRDALVINMPGVTRDRQYGEAVIQERPCVLIDTGGLSGEDVGVDGAMAAQAMAAVEEADIVCFLVDGRQGVANADQAIAKQLRHYRKPIVLVVNKTDGVDVNVAMSDFYQLGLGEPLPIAASHRRGLQALGQKLLTLAPEAIQEEPEADDEAVKRVRMALIGRPNVGKSTLTNRFLGEERVVVYDLPGTTRDSIEIPMERHGKHYTLIDTAGVRRKGKVTQTLEKFSVVKTLKAIEEAHVAIVLVDAQEGITEQDLHLIGFALDAGRGLVIAVNKWDGLDQEHKDRVKQNLQRRLGFVAKFVEIHFISALYGTGVGHLYDAVNLAYRSSMKKVKTPEVNRLLELALFEHEPPLVRGRRIKLRYAHVGGHNPLVIVVHGNQTERISDDYRRYLSNFFRKQLRMMGALVKVEFKSSDNPFKGRRNKLTPRQEMKKRRLMKKVKKK